MKINLLIRQFLGEARCGSKPHLQAWGLPKYFLKLHETEPTGPGAKAIIFLKLMREKRLKQFPV